MKMRRAAVTTPKPKIEPWERAGINRLTWRALAAGFSAMLLGVLISNLLALVGIGQFHWGMLTLGFFVPAAYHEGVCAERQRAGRDGKAEG